MEVRIVGRPQVPDGYGVTEKGPFLDWSVVETWLTGSNEYWLASTRPDGRPTSFLAGGCGWTTPSGTTGHRRHVTRRMSSRTRHALSIWRADGPR